MKRNHDERGSTLITTLVLLMVVTLVGIIAVNTATVDIQIAGNAKRATGALEGAEAGTNLSVPIIESTIVSGGILTPSAPTGVITGLDTGNLANEIMANDVNDPDTPSGAPDVSITNLSRVNVNVDIDYLFTSAVTGGNQNMGMGYEGIGAGSAGGGAASIYRLQGEGTS